MCFLFWEGAASLRSCGIMIFFINDLILQRVSLSSTTCLAAGGPPPSAEEGKGMCLDVGYGKMQLVRVSACRLGAAVLPLRREAFGVGAAWVHLCCKTRLFVQKFYAFSCYFITCLLSGV